jgi:hypothetical protein
MRTLPDASGGGRGGGGGGGRGGGGWGGRRVPDDPDWHDNGSHVVSCLNTIAA